jgi:CBS domain containing-hemolysin-like protein
VVFGSAWFGLFSAGMTLLILFFSEIIPKTLGAVYWNTLAWPTALFVRFLIIVLYPLIFISELLTRLIAHGKEVHVFSREEFLAMADMGAQSGHLREHESRIIRSLFRAEKLTAEDIMTPRTVIVAFPEEMTVSEVLRAHPENPFSRLPIYKGQIDNITGFILKDDLLLAKAEGRGDEKIDGLRRELSTVTADMSLAALLEYLFDERLHIALVAGDYGGTRGLVTLEDVVETLLGLEIVDEMDEVVDMQAFARRQWEKRAGALGLSIENPEPRTPPDRAPEADQADDNPEVEESPAPSETRSSVGK